MTCWNGKVKDHRRIVRLVSQCASAGVDVRCVAITRHTIACNRFHTGRMYLESVVHHDAITQLPLPVCTCMNAINGNSTASLLVHYEQTNLMSLPASLASEEALNYNTCVRTYNEGPTPEPSDLKITYCSFFLLLGLVFKDQHYMHLIFFLKSDTKHSCGVLYFKLNFFPLRYCGPEQGLHGQRTWQPDTSAAPAVTVPLLSGSSKS